MSASGGSNAYEVPVALAPGLRRVLEANPSSMTAFGTNSYVIGHDELALIDAGYDDARHRAALVELVGDRLRYILITHWHPDHAEGAAALATATGAAVLGHAARGAYRPDRILEDGEVLTVDDVALEAVFTPGHASDHLCFFSSTLAGGALFSGDTILGGPTVTVSAPDGDMAAYFASIEKLLSREDSFARIFPGHGEVVTEAGPQLRGYLEHRRDREQQVTAVLAALAPASPAQIAEVIYGELDEALTSAARATTWAHLRKLEHDGRATTTNRDDPSATWSPA